MGHLIVLTWKYCKLCDLYCNLQISIKLLEKFESEQNISLIRKKFFQKRILSENLKLNNLNNCNIFWKSYFLLCVHDIASFYNIAFKIYGFHFSENEAIVTLTT